MTQPSFVPIVEADQVRPAYRLRVPSIWTQSRPSEVRGTSQPEGRLLGKPGPDQGFALKLARRFEARLVLAEGDSAEDAIAGVHRGGHAPLCPVRTGPGRLRPRVRLHPVGLPRGRPGDLVEARSPLFRSAAHHYQAQRAIADSVNEETLRMTPDAVADRIGEWRDLLTLPPRH